ncbi:MAG: DAK2 domain-containing protein [Clostridia bacterium]|nr:DAK2 domain-containing protein [Clostridia bacterium]
MSALRLDGQTFLEMLICGAKNLKDNAERINDLNVFPVPDGDTGTNMTMTMEGGLAAVINEKPESIGAAADKFSGGALLGARGNSGVILSQIFAGISEVLADKREASTLELCEAYESGIKKSYSAVQNPTEGTILTVFRESVEYVRENIDKIETVEDFYKYHIEAAERSLMGTKELLPVLAEADVVDSGGAGYLCIAVGMYSALTGEMHDVTYSLDTVGESKARVNIDAFTRDSVLEFGYCTEFLLRLMSAKVDPDAFDEKIIVNELEALGGESIVAFKTGDVIKVHVHTFTPGEVLSACQKYGEFLTLKIENMSLEHSEREKPDKKPKPFSVVAVANGEGICSLFESLGADVIIHGGQTQNPSTEEFTAAFDSCAGEKIIVFPNNKNIFLAAKQAAELWTEKDVYIVPTRNIPEGYSALSVITPGITDIDSLVESATRAAEGTVSAQITRAVRSVTIDGQEIEEGEYIAISDGKIAAVSVSAEDALQSMLESVEDIDLMEIMTLFVGACVTASVRAEITEKLEELYPDIEITVYEGGQDVYDYLVAIE